MTFYATVLMSCHQSVLLSSWTAEVTSGLKSTPCRVPRSHLEVSVPAKSFCWNCPMKCYCRAWVLLAVCDLESEVWNQHALVVQTKMTPIIEISHALIRCREQERDLEECCGFTGTSRGHVHPDSSWDTYTGLELVDFSIKGSWRKLKLCRD